MIISQPSISGGNATLEIQLIHLNQLRVLLLYGFCTRQSPHRYSGSVFYRSVSGAGHNSIRFGRLIIGHEQSQQRGWNGKVMTDQQWRTVAAVIQEAEAALEQTLTERLATAVRELNVPLSVLERMQRSANAAVGRAFQNPTTRLVDVTILTPAMGEALNQTSRSWGFFLVDRGCRDGAQHHIDVFVYPDGG